MMAGINELGSEIHPRLDFEPGWGIAKACVAGVCLYRKGNCLDIIGIVSPARPTALGPKQYSTVLVNQETTCKLVAFF